jgi:hypothetical protein
MLAYFVDELPTVAGEFRLADAGQRGELPQVERLALRHLAQRGIVKDDVRRQSIL